MRAARPPTDDDSVANRREQVVELTRTGLSARDIAVRLRITERSVQRHRAAAGVAQSATIPLSAEELNTAYQMLSDGCSRAEVARTINRGVTALKQYFPDLCWTRQQIGAYSATVRYLESKVLDERR